MDPKILGNRYDAEDGPDVVQVLGSQNLPDTDLGQFPDCRKIVFFQPPRYIRVLAFLASQFDDRDNCIGIPVYFPAFSINPHQVWNRCE